jgi:hypothetical protein
LQKIIVAPFALIFWAVFIALAAIPIVLVFGRIIVFAWMIGKVLVQAFHHLFS